MRSCCKVQYALGDDKHVGICRVLEYRCLCCCAGVRVQATINGTVICNLGEYLETGWGVVGQTTEGNDENFLLETKEKNKSKLKYSMSRFLANMKHHVVFIPTSMLNVATHIPCTKRHIFLNSRTKQIALSFASFPLHGTLIT